MSTNTCDNLIDKVNTETGRSDLNRAKKKKKREGIEFIKLGVSKHLNLQVVANVAFTASHSVHLRGDLNHLL